MATLRVAGCRLDTKSILVYFSEKVDGTSGQTGATNLANYIVFAPNSGLNNPQQPLSQISQAPNVWTVFMVDDRTASLSAPATLTFDPGDAVHITVLNVQAFDGSSHITSQSVSGQVPGSPDTKKVTRDVEDAISYPILTEEVAYRPSPVGIPTTGAGGIAGPGASNLGQVALQAVSDVLGWKANPADPKGFIGALTQSFTLSDVEGHTEATWKPRSYAVQTDLGGGITGAQASLYMRAKDALDQSLTLLDGLYPLDPEADPEYVKALREMARSQMTEIVKEFGVVGLPSILRINTYFGILLGQNAANLTAGEVQLDPDQIAGTLGKLRDTYGIYFRGNPFNNSVQDEQDITNFRVISDYMTSLLQSWIANREFFILKPRIPAFFGTQLVLISRQFNVIAETVNELRFALDSVFIGPNERQTLLLEFDDHSLPPMFLEDVLDEVDKFVTEEGPRLLRDGGKISVTNNILPVVDTLRHMIEQAHHPKDQKRRVPDGFRTARVRHALDDLQKQLTDLVDLTRQVEQQVPPPEGKPIIKNLTVSQTGAFPSSVMVTAQIFGDQFDSAVEVDVFSTATTGLGLIVTFVSSQEVDISFELQSSSDLSVGSHDIVVTNPDGQFSRFNNAFTWDGATVSAPSISTAPAAKRALRGRPGGAASKSRAVALSVQGQPVPPGPPVPRPGAGGSAPGTGSSAAAALPTGTSAAVDQQLKAVQDKYEVLQQGLSDLQTSQSALSQKIDDVQKNVQDTLASYLVETKKSHESVMEEMKSWWAKATGSEGKKSKTKDE